MSSLIVMRPLVWVWMVFFFSFASNRSNIKRRRQLMRCLLMMIHQGVIWLKLKVWWALSICDIIACCSSFFLFTRSLFVAIFATHHLIENKWPQLKWKWQTSCNQPFSTRNTFKTTLKSKISPSTSRIYNERHLSHPNPQMRMHAMKVACSCSNNSNNLIHWWCEQTVSNWIFI